MRILWLCNMIPGLIQEQLTGKSGGGLWVDHVLADLMARQDCSIRLLCMGLQAVSGRIGEVDYTLFQEKVPERYYPELEALFRQQLQEFQPDVIHIWGTEFGHTLAMMNACEKEQLLDRAVISIQGLCSFVPQHHNEGIPEKWIHRYSFRDFLRQDNLAQEARTYAQRGVLELEALKKARHVIGRTEWDRACTSQVSPQAQYHFCNETMREPFYTGVWKYDSCNKHQIFGPNWKDPSKGVHYLFEAFSEVLKDYPDATICFTGSSVYPATLKEKLRMRAHHQYLISLIEQYGIRDKVKFLGSLTAEEMKETYLKSNVYVLPSNVENSPNTVCESMLLGVPCVSSLTGGLLKMMIHGKEGFLYQPSASYMLAYYIKQVFAMGEEAEKIGAAAREHALKTHDPENNMRTLLEIYEKVAG